MRTTPSIGHPANGYKLTLAPRVAEDAEIFANEHAHSNGPVRCEVLYRRGRYCICLTTQPGANTLPPEALWCIHAHYRTGLDLYGIDAHGEVNPVTCLADLASVCGVTPDANGVRAAVEARRLYPENIGPRFGTAG